MKKLATVAHLAYLAAPGQLGSLAAFLRRSVPEPLPLPTAYEILLQSYLFFGYAQAIESLRIFAETVTAAGLEHPSTGNDGGTDADYLARGERLCRRIYHPNFDQLITNMRDISPELGKWMVMEGYGRVLSRPGPSELEREIASIVFLSCSGHPVQLFSHVRGARNLGATPELLRESLGASGLAGKKLELAEATITRVFG